MKKFIILCFSIIFVLLFFTKAINENTSIGNNDWSYSINDEYQVWHVNSETIVIGKMDTPNAMSHVVESYVSKFAYNSEYLVAERKPEGKNSEKKEYYIVELENGIIYGPINIADLPENIRNIGVGELCDWIYTQPRPDRAVFP